MKKFALTALTVLMAAAMVAPGAQAANFNKFANTVVPYYCGGNESAAYVNIPNSHRLAVQANLVDTAGNAGVVYNLNNVPAGTLTFLFSSQANFIGEIFVVSSSGSGFVSSDTSTLTNKALKGKYPFGGGAGTVSVNLANILPAGTTVSQVYVYGTNPTSATSIYFDQFTYAGVPLVKDTFTSDINVCGLIPLIPG